MPTPKKSDFLHSLQGTKSQVKTDAPDFPAGRPKMPLDLSPVAEAEWRRIVPKLGKRKTLTKADASSIEIYVREFARYKKVAAIAEEEPLERVSWLDANGIEHFKTVESAASKVAAKLACSLRNFLKELSATPASRDKTKPPIEKPEPLDEFPTRDEVAPVGDETPDIDVNSIDLSNFDTEIQQ
ncbi:MAG: P27 family phage terminase small subunit [Terriglobales bacterium]